MNRLIKWLGTLNVILGCIICLEITACAHSAVEFHYKIIDKELKPYVSEYYRLLNKYCKNRKYNKSSHYIIFLDDINEYRGDGTQTIGVCYHKLFGFEVEIDRGWWESSNESLRKQLIYHEMAHCLINQEHSPNKSNYMYQGLFPNDNVETQSIQDIKDYCQ